LEQSYKWNVVNTTASERFMSNRQHQVMIRTT